MGISMLFPAVIIPFAHGVPGGHTAWDFLAGMREQQFMRACYGSILCAVIGIVVTLVTRPEPLEKQRGLVWGTIGDALRHYKGSAGRESQVTRALAMPQLLQTELPHFGTAELAGIRISSALARQLDAHVGDLVYITDSRWWTGGLHSAHVIVAEISEQDGQATVAMEETAFRNVVGKRLEQPVRLERLYK
jgi:SSS family solute:Na+ symporter